jgi:hypothetical protein
MGCEDLVPTVRCWLATLGPLWVLLGTAGPAAATQPFSLSWQAPPECPGQAEVEAEIASALSHLRGSGPVEVTAEVTAQSDPPGFSLRVRVSHAGQIGERLLPIDDCSDASRAAALLVALSVDNQPPPPPPPLLPPPPPELPPRFTWTIGAGPHLVEGIAPELSVGFGLAVAVSSSFWRISLRGAGFAASDHTLPGKQAGGSFQLLTGGAFGCAGYPGSPISFYGCLGGRLDHLRGTGFGATQSYSESTRIASVAGGATLEWSLTRRFRLRTELEGGYPLGHARFTIAGLGTVHEVGDLRGEAALELAVVF